MALENNENLKSAALAPLFEDYSEWFGHIAVSISYLDEDTQVDKITAPESFPKWLEEKSGQYDLNSQVVTGLAHVYADMIKKGNAIAETLQSETRPDYDDFLDLKNLYNSFVLKLAQLDQGQDTYSDEYDTQTGLRKPKHIASDQKKEMERLRRQGTLFSLVMLRIDGFDEAQKDRFLEPSVRVIKKCLRAFDDSYYLDDGHFLLSLKQTDIVGGEAATDRLTILLKEEDVDFTFSYFLSEPVEYDEIDDLLKCMREDLDKHKSEGNVSLRLLELSPLQKFMGAKN
ncbi:MAG: hypothetical protein AAF549_07540 [Pseudomonadota bacterium]